MARARNIKPGFFKNEDLAELNYEARLLFAGLWTLADREGRLEDRPKKIKMEVFPGDSLDVDKLLQKLHDAGGFIQRYEVEGKRYIQIINFKKHQSPHFKEPPSTIPKPGALPPLNAGANPGLEAVSKRAKPRAKPPSKGGRTALIADSGFSDSGLPDAGLRTAESPSPSTSSAAVRRRPNGEAEGRTVDLWHAYAGAYQHRYGIAPIRNAKVNGMLAKFLERVPLEEAPDIAAFYVGHHKGLYVSAKHCVDLLLRDAEGLRTEWATGRTVTDSEARQTDRTAGQLEQVNRLLAEAGAKR